MRTRDVKRFIKTLKIAKAYIKANKKNMDASILAVAYNHIKADEPDDLKSKYRIENRSLDDEAFFNLSCGNTKAENEEDLDSCSCEAMFLTTKKVGSYNFLYRTGIDNGLYCDGTAGEWNGYPADYVYSEKASAYDLIYVINTMIKRIKKDMKKRSETISTVKKHRQQLKKSHNSWDEIAKTISD